MSKLYEFSLVSTYKYPCCSNPFYNRCPQICTFFERNRHNRLIIICVMFVVLLYCKWKAFIWIWFNTTWRVLSGHETPLQALISWVSRSWEVFHFLGCWAELVYHFLSLFLCIFICVFIGRWVEFGCVNHFFSWFFVYLYFCLYWMVDNDRWRWVEFAIGEVAVAIQTNSC